MTIDAEELKSKCMEFDRVEGRASFYRLAAGVSENLPLHASVILLATWNAGRFRFFANDSNNLVGLEDALDRSRPLFAQLRHIRFEDADFNLIRDKVDQIYALLSAVKGVEYTGASKIMHLLKPDLFVMWDSYIRDHYSLKNWDANDYLDFLKLMQKKFAGIKWDATDRTLPKAIDEYNYVTITLPEQEKQGKRRRR